MVPPNLTYTLVLMTASVICLAVAVVVWVNRRGAAGAVPLAVLLLGLSWWDVAYAMFWDDFRGPTPYFWLDITLIGAYIVPTAFLVFVLDYSGVKHWVRGPTIMALMIEPVLMGVLQWTDPWHDLFFGGKRHLSTTFIVSGGPAFWMNVIYSYLLILISAIVLVRTGIRSMGIYRKQTLFMLGASALPWIAHIGFVSSGRALLPNADMTPFIFSVTASLIGYSLIYYRFLDIMPIARSILIENMGEGVLVLDSYNRVVDINPVARDTLALHVELGDPVVTALADYPQLVARFIDENQEQVEVEVKGRCLDLRITTMVDPRRRKVGRLVVWRDITDIKNAQMTLEKLATTDDLTMAYNRRFFLKLAEAQVNRSQRGGHPLSLALIDLDHFKLVNDNFGHLVGDDALAAFAGLVRNSVRDFDIFGRLGGEEFALLMPDTDCEDALHVLDRLRQTLFRNPPIIEGHIISLTFSAGLAESAGEGDVLVPLLRRADQALYAAKAAGRNCIMVWDEGMETSLEQTQFFRDEQTG